MTTFLFFPDVYWNGISFLKRGGVWPLLVTPPLLGSDFWRSLRHSLLFGSAHVLPPSPAPISSPYITSALTACNTCSNSFSVVSLVSVAVVTWFGCCGNVQRPSLLVLLFRLPADISQYGHGFRGIRNQEWLCWRRPPVINQKPIVEYATKSTDTIIIIFKITVFRTEHLAYPSLTSFK
jgi:hypothetical protein